MVHELSQFAFELPAVDEWLSGDDRVLAFRVVDDNGNPVDISTATVAWELYDRPYTDIPADAVLTGGDSGVELVTDSRVDSENGEWEVRVDGAATGDLWGEYWHRPSVEQAGGSSASWRGRAVLTA